MYAFFKPGPLKLAFIENCQALFVDKSTTSIFMKC